LKKASKSPQSAAPLLLKVIELHPEVVAGVLAGEGVAI
jgi:DNA-binding transcriptional regulator YiaG